MPTRCELIAKAKEKGLKGYSKMKKAELQALVEGGKAEAPKKTYAFKKKEAPKPAPLKATGTARRVKAKDTEAGKAQAKQVSGFMGKVKEGRDKRVRGTKDVKPKSKPARGDYGLAPPTAAFVVPQVDGPEDGNPIYEPTHDEAWEYTHEVTKFGIASKMMRGKAYAKSIAEKKQRLRDHPVGQWAARNPTAMKLKLRL